MDDFEELSLSMVIFFSQLILQAFPMLSFLLHLVSNNDLMDSLVDLQKSDFCRMEINNQHKNWYSCDNDEKLDPQE